MQIIDSISNISQEKVFPIFFWDKWKTVEEKLHHKQRLLCADEENNVVAFTIYAMKFFKKADYLYAPLDKNGNRLSVEKEKKFLEEFHNYLKENKIADAIFPPTHLVVFCAVPSGVMYYKIGILVTNLKQSEDSLMSKINPKVRTELRKAEKLDVKILHGKDYIKSFYDCFQGTVKQKGISNFSLKYFNDISQILGENAVFSIAMLNNNIEASLFSLKDDKYFYPSYSGTSYMPQYKGSNKYLIWHIYTHLMKTGVEKFYYGGYRYDIDEKDPLNNIQKFKMRLGCDIEDGYHFIKVINPLKYNFVSLAMKCKSLLTGKNYSFVNLKGLDVKKSK